MRCVHEFRIHVAWFVVRVLWLVKVWVILWHTHETWWSNLYIDVEDVGCRLYKHASKHLVKRIKFPFPVIASSRIHRFFDAEHQLNVDKMRIGRVKKTFFETLWLMIWMGNSVNQKHSLHLLLVCLCVFNRDKHFSITLKWAKGNLLIL